MNIFVLIGIKLIVLTVLLLNNGFNCDDSFSQSYDLENDQQFANFKHNFDSLAAQLLKSLKIAHKLDRSEELVRQKRSAQYRSSNVNPFFDKGVHRLRGIVPLFPTCSLSLDFKTIEFYGQTYGICVSAQSHVGPAKVTVGPITRNGWEPNRISWNVIEPQNIVSFVDEDKDTKERNLYVLVADSGSRDGTDVVVINKYNQRITKEQHTVNSRYPTAIAVWKSRTDHTYHLAIANSHGPDGTQSYKSETFTYNWMGTYFDEYSSMTTYFVKDICAFNIHSNEFLAIANYKAGPNIIQIDSEIFKLDIDRKKWRTFQRIRTFGAVDWEFFTFGSDKDEEYFLAVANSFDTSHGRTVFEVNSVIYKFSDDKFVPFQCLPTVGATQIKTFKGRNGEFVLAVSNMYESVHLYQYNGWHFVETRVQYTGGVMSPGVASLHFDYLPFERSGVLFVSNPRHPSGFMFKMDFVHENPLGEWHNRSLGWCQNTHNEVSRSGTDNLMPQFKDVYYVDQAEPIVINDLVLGDLVTDSLSTPVLVDESNGDEFSHKMIEDLIRLDQEINAVEAKIAEIIDLLTHALRTDGEQVVTASYTFKSVDFECRPEDECHVRQVNTQTLNNDNVLNLAEDILPLNIDHEIPHPMHFENLRVDKDVILNGLINGLNTSHIVTRHGSHDIIARKTFTNTVTANEVIVEHFVNEKLISPSTVLLTDRDQFINNTIKFDDNIRVANLQVNGPIDGINIDVFYNELVTKDSDHIIIGDKHFKELEINDLHMRPGATIDGIDIMKIWNDVMWTYADQDIVAPINFTDITIDRNLFVDGLINGIRIPNDILLTNQNAVITGNKQFSSAVKIDNVEILHSINGIGLVGMNRGWNNQLDIMIKSKMQTIVGPKVFNQMHLGGHSLVAGTVDGVKLSELKRILLFKNSSLHFDSLEINGNVYFDGGLKVMNDISGFKIEDLYTKTLKLNDSNIPLFPHLRINFADMNSLNCYSINGLNIGTDLMTKQSPQLISGRKTFVNGVKMDEDFRVKSINGVDLGFINDTLMHGGEQIITGEKVFVGDLLVDDLRVKNINNISMDDIVLLNRDETITAPKVLNDVQVLGDLNIDSLETPVVNGVDLRELYTNSLLFDRPQVVTGRLNVASILIPKGSNLETKSVNGIDLHQSMSDAVLVDVPQTIFGEKIFRAPITIGHIKFSNSFDNVTDWDIKQNWMLQDVSQIVNANLIFDNNVVVNHDILMRNPTINNINLNLLNNNTVKIDEPTVIHGPTQFSGQVVSDGHIDLRGRMQGIDLDKEAITLNGNHRINGRIHFANGFEVDENLNVNGTIDEVVVEELCRYAVRKNSNQVITGPTSVSGNVIFKGPLTVGSGVNGINIEGFYRSVVKVDEPANLKGIKKFKNLILVGPVAVKGSIAGVDINQLFNKYMSLTRDQVINSRIVFMNNLNINKDLIVNGNLITQNGLINGINLPQLDATVLKTYGNQIISGDFIFEDNVHFGQQLNILNRKLNNIDLNRDLMLKGRNNILTAPKVFAEDINVNNNLDITDGKTIQDVDVSEMAKHSVMKADRKYNILGNKHFNSLEVDHLRVGLINGVDMSNRSVLVNYGNQQIFGTKIIKNHLTVSSEINANNINGINIGQLSQRLVLKGYNNTISSFKKFNSLTVHNVHAFGKVDGVDVNELNYFIGLPVDLLDLRLQLMDMDEKIDLLERAFENQAIDLAYYQLIQSLPSGQLLDSYYNFKTKSHHLFVSGHYLNNGCQEIEVYEHSIYSSNNGLNLARKLYAIDASSMTIFTLNGYLFVLISNSRIGVIPDCLKQNPSTHVSQYGSGPAISQVFRLNERNEYQQIALIHSEPVLEMKVIQDQYITPCIVFVIPVANGVLGHPIVICMDNNGNFNPRETLPLPGTDQTSILRSSVFNTTLLASTNFWQSSHSISEIVINHWSPELGHFDHSIQTIAFLNPSAIHLTESPRDLSAFLLASEKKTSLTHNPLVRIYRYNHKQFVPFVEVQQIKESEVLSIDSTLSDDSQLLVFMLTNDRINLYRLKGSSGFVLVDRIAAQNANNFRVFNNYDINNRIDGHLISIYFEKGCDARHNYLCKRENHILKSKINGKVLNYNYT